MWSSPSYRTCGVTRGSILDPLIFVIYANDLVQFVQNTNICQYAADIYISKSSNSILMICASSTVEVRNIEGGPRLNNLQLNMGKNKTLQFFAQKIEL